MSALVGWTLLAWAVSSLAFAWAWARAARQRPPQVRVTLNMDTTGHRRAIRRSLDLIDAYSGVDTAAREARVLEDDAALAAWLDGGAR